MNNSVLCEKDYVSVLPRIIDPKMQFTKESIESTIDNKIANTPSSRESKKLTKKDDVKIESVCEPKRGITDFISDYKYVILTIVIVMIVIALIYFVYRYYSNKNKKKEIVEENKEDTEVPAIESSEDIKAKEETVKAYLSGYIEDDDINDVDDETDYIEEIGTNNKTEHIEELLEDHNNIIYNSNMPVYNTIIISDTSEYGTSSNIPKNNIDTFEVEEIIEDVTDNDQIESENETTSNNDIINKLIGSNEHSDDTENYDSLLDDDCILNSKKTDDIIDSIDEIDTNYDHIFNNSNILETTKPPKKEAKYKKKSKAEVVSKPVKLESSDDINYFKKFNNTS